MSKIFRILNLILLATSIFTGIFVGAKIAILSAFLAVITSFLSIDKGEKVHSDLAKWMILISFILLTFICGKEVLIKGNTTETPQSETRIEQPKQIVK